MVSDKVSCNNGKDCRYVEGYNFDGALMPLFIKMPKNISSYDVSQNDKNSVYTMSFNVFEVKEWVLQYKKISNKVESQLFEKLTTEPINREGKYVHGKWKMWNEPIKTNFHSQDVLYDMYCNPTALLKIDSVYKVKTIILRYLKETCLGRASKRYRDGW